MDIVTPTKIKYSDAIAKIRVRSWSARTRVRPVRHWALPRKLDILIITLIITHNLTFRQPSIHYINGASARAPNWRLSLSESISDKFNQSVEHRSYFPCSMLFLGRASYLVITDLELRPWYDCCITGNYPLYIFALNSSWLDENNAQI
jgi:hypothetical protein